MRLVMEMEGEDEPVALPGEGRDLVAFISFAAMRGFGAEHPLIALAERLQREHGLKLGPLTTFYDRAVDDAEDAEKIERAWQQPAPLHAALEAVANVLDADAMARTLAKRAQAIGIGEQARALLAPLERAAGAGRRVRLVYEL